MRILLLFFMAFFAAGTKAQHFELTPSGFVDSNNPQNDFVVVPFEGKSQMEIYNLALGALGKSFTSTNDNVSKVEYSQINLNGLMPEVTFINRIGMILPFDMHYNLILEFKDGKMKVNGPIINDIIRVAPLGGAQHIYLIPLQKSSNLSGDLVIFKKDGQVKEKKHKLLIETKINDFVSRIIKLMNSSGSDW